MLSKSQSINAPYLLHSLESVSVFRAEIMRKASMNLFKERDNAKEKTAIKKVKGQEHFPQPFKREKLKNRRGSRYKTQPVTSQELNEIPESEPVTKSTAIMMDRSTDDEAATTTATEDEEMHTAGTVTPETEDSPARDEETVLEVVETQDEGRTSETVEETQTSDIGSPSVDEVPQQSLDMSCVQDDKGSTSSLVDDTCTNKAEDNGEDNGENNDSASITEASPATPVEPQSPHHRKHRVSSTSSSTKLSEGDSDDDFDKLVEINYKEIIASKQTAPVTVTKAQPEPSAPMAQSIEQGQGHVTQAKSEADISTIMMSGAHREEPLERDSVRSLQIQEEEEEEEEAAEDELSKKSLSEKMSFFQQLDQQSRSAPSRRFLDKKQRGERAKTQPLTREEVTLASEYAKEERAEQERAKVAISWEQGRRRSIETVQARDGERDGERESGSEDELSK